MIYREGWKVIAATRSKSDTEWLRRTQIIAVFLDHEDAQKYAALLRKRHTDRAVVVVPAREKVAGVLRSTARGARA